MMMSAKEKEFRCELSALVINNDGADPIDALVVIENVDF